MLNLYKYMYYLGGIASLIFAYLYFSTQKYIIFVVICFAICIAGRQLYYRTAAKMVEEKARMKRREERNKNK